MNARGLVWSAGVVVAVLALLAALVVASALPAGYDFRAYWLAVGPFSALIRRRWLREAERVLA